MVPIHTHHTSQPDLIYSLIRPRVESQRSRACAVELSSLSLARVHHQRRAVSVGNSKEQQSTTTTGGCFETGC